MLVPFAGPGAGEGPLTWGQAQCWWAMVATSSSLAMGAVMVAPPGRTPEDYARTLSFWMSRYASLRTRLRLTDPPTQVVAGEGAAEPRIVAGADPERTAHGLLAEWKSAPFDHEREWPVRLAVVTRDGAVTHAVMVIYHRAADTVSVEVMSRELLDPDRGPYPAPQPLELAVPQTQPAARRQSAAALRFREARLRSVPAPRSAPPRDRPGWTPSGAGASTSACSGTAGAPASGGPAATERQPDREEAMDFFSERLTVHVEDVPGTVRISAEVDTRHLAAADAWAVLDRIESAHCP